MNNFMKGKKSMKQVKTTNAPAAIGPYSQAIAMGNMLFTSGQIPINPETGNIPDGVEAQARQALKNVSEVIKAGGADMSKVIKTTVFIKNMEDFAKINEIYAEFFTEPYPARSCVEVARLPKDVLLEIEAIAER